MTEFTGVCGRRKLRVNVSKSKVMVVSKDGRYKTDIHLHGEKMEQVKCFRYLGTAIQENGRMGKEIRHRVREGERVGGALKTIWRNKGMSIGAMRRMHEAIVAPTLTYRSAAWVMNAREWSSMDAVEMRRLWDIKGVTKYDRVGETVGSRKRQG